MEQKWPQRREKRTSHGIFELTYRFSEVRDTKRAQINGSLREHIELIEADEGDKNVGRGHDNEWRK